MCYFKVWTSFSALWHFRLNDKHKEKAAGKRVRGKRTRAKEILYKHILQEVRKWKPGFNAGITTGIPGGLKDLWEQPYRHWNFRSYEYEYDPKKTKRQQKKPD